MSQQVLAQALELVLSGSSSGGSKRGRSSSSGGSNGHDSSNSTGTHRIPLPGTSKEDFLVVAEFMYPMAPLPKVSWDNLEVLLVEGRKWSMPVR
jgi:hypothetical protein